MTSKKNAAQVAAQAELCLNSAVVWIPCLLIEGEPLPDGITTSNYERLPGLFPTSAEAMAAAHIAMATRLDAIGYCAKRVEVPDGI